MIDEEVMDLVRKIMSDGMEEHSTIMSPEKTYFILVEFKNKISKSAATFFCVGSNCLYPERQGCAGCQYSTL